MSKLDHTLVFCNKLYRDIFPINFAICHFFRVYDSEYSSRFKFVNGAWIESPELQGRPNPVSFYLYLYVFVNSNFQNVQRLPTTVCTALFDKGWKMVFQMSHIILVEFQGSSSLIV